MNPITRSLAIMFADVAGSSGLYERHGNASALASIELCLNVMRAVTSEFSGRVVKTIGDELMVVFDNAEDAFCASCEIQWRVSDLPPLGADKISVRIGFHFGDALQQEGDVFGDSVNIAARLVELAKAGQILTSGRTFDIMGKPHTTHMRKLNSLSLRGMSYVETIYEGLWQDDENITAMLSGVMDQPGGQTSARLTYGGKAIDFDAQCKLVTFGRDPTNSVVVTSRKASRAHARIERRREKLILIDQSANGTYVKDEQGRETVLRLEEMALRGQGFVSFGEPVETRGASLLEYVLDSTISAAETSEQSLDKTGQSALSIS